MDEFKEEDAKRKLEEEYEKAKKLLNDKDKVEEFLKKVEEKIATIQKLGDTLSNVPTMISLVRSYIKKDYLEVPSETITFVLSALLYVFNPFDIVPDTLSEDGYLDDDMVITVCLKLVSNDMEEYRKWRENHNL